MRRLISWVVILGLGHAILWVGTASLISAGAPKAVEKVAQQGWQITYNTIETSGYPARLNTQVQGPVVTSPDQSWTWQAPRLDMTFQSLQPNRVDVRLPAQQTITVQGQVLNVTSDGLLTFAHTGLQASLPLQATGATVQSATLASDQGWNLRTGPIDAQLTAKETGEAEYAVIIDANDIRLPRAWVRPLDPNRVLRRAAIELHVQADLAFDAPLDRHNPEPVLRGLDLHMVQFAWGDVVITSTGKLRIGRNGVPRGVITLTTADWQVLIDLLSGTGVVPPRMARTLAGMAGALADDTGQLALPLNFKDGFMSLGPLPLGPAPRFPTG